MEENILKRNNVKVTGEGTKTIIFVPGFGCDQNIWRFVAPFFERNIGLSFLIHVGRGSQIRMLTVLVNIAIFMVIHGMYLTYVQH